MSWQPVNLAAPEYAKPSEPPSNAGLIYDGKRHLISGPPEAAKTLLALILALQAIRSGGVVAIVDFENGPYETRRLLEDLGATPEEIGSILYFEPDGPPDDEDIETIVSNGVTLTVIDALAGAYDVSGLDDERRREVEKFSRIWIRPLWQRGVATLAIDHVVKNAENRGRFSIGSERKLGAVDVHLGLRSVKQLHRGSIGLVTVIAHKDRPAHLDRPVAAEVELVSDPTTNAITWTITNVPSAEDTFRPTVLMDRVSRYVELRPDGVTRTQVYKDVTGKRAGLVTAVDILIRDGHLTDDGSRLRSLHPYRAGSPGSPGSQAVPGPFPDPRSPSVPPVPPPLGGNREPGNQPFPLPGDETYLPPIFAAFQADLITEGEWRQADLLHRLASRGKL